MHVTAPRQGGGNAKVWTEGRVATHRPDEIRDGSGEQLITSSLRSDMTPAGHQSPSLIPAETR